MHMHSKIHKEWIFDATEDDFQQTVIDASHSKPILVDFWADWCGPCIMLTPVLEHLVSESEGRWLLGKVEVDDNMRLAGHYRLRGFPTVLLFQDGEEKGRFSGAKPSPWVKHFLEEHGVEA